MPITEVPNIPPSTPPEPPRLRRRGNRYEDYEAHDLLSVIEELEGDRNWAALREKVWIALIVHMIVFWFMFYGPKYIFHVKVIDPSTVLRQRQKEMTYLDLPPDALKNIKPKPAPLSDKNRVAQSPHPTLDKKTLEQLQAMRRAGPPAPQPAPPQQQPQQQAPAPPQPQQPAAQSPPAPPAQPLPNNQESKLEAPKAAPTKPNFQTGQSSSLSQDLQQLARNSQGGQSGGGDMGAGAPSQHSGMNGAVDVLSDTMGWDYGPYIQRVVFDTKRAWYPIIPEAARPPLSKQGRVAIRFKIFHDGSVKDMVLEGPSGDVSLDRAAWGGITGASPYPPMPKDFKGPYLELRFYFLYNLEPKQ